MDISKAIIALREAKRMKQSEVAEKLGIERSNYARMEKRGKKLTLDQITGIADALEVDVREILNYGVQKPDKAENEKVKQLEDRTRELEELVNVLKKNEQYLFNRYYHFTERILDDVETLLAGNEIVYNDRDNGIKLSGYEAVRYLLERELGFITDLKKKTDKK